MLVSREKLDYSTLDLRGYWAQPSHSECHQNRSGVKGTKLHYNIEGKIIEKQTKRTEI